MNNKIPVCGRCKKTCKKQEYADPTWFGRYFGDKLLEVICIDCWGKGEKWENSSSLKK